MKIIVGERRSGKTTAAVEWLLQGHEVEGYPGWSRIIIVPTMQMLDSFRAEHYREIPDFSHRVYAKPEWDHRSDGPWMKMPQILYEEAQMYLPLGASAITITGDVIATGVT